MLLSLSRQVAVYLIRYHPQPVFFDDTGHLARFAFRPHPARRIVRITPYHQLYRRIRGLCSKILKIHPEMPAIVYQIRAHELPAAVPARMLEKTIRRCHEQHLFIRLCQQLHQLVKRRDHTRRKNQLFSWKIPAVAFPAPARERIVIPAVEHARISEDPFVYPLLQSLTDLGCYRELHVGHPHPDELVIRHRKLYVRLVRKHIRTKSLDIFGIRIFPVYYFIKIISHSIISLSQVCRMIITFIEHNS